jgi:hypothetical protein
MTDSDSKKVSSPPGRYTEVVRNPPVFKGRQNEGSIPESGCMWSVGWERPRVKVNSYRALLLHDSLPNVSSFLVWTLINNV